MNRRTFITMLGGAAASSSLWPLAVRAQQRAMPVIGLLHSGSPKTFAHPARSFHRGLGEAGYVEGRNVTIEARWAEDDYDRLPALAADLVRRQVAVIVADGGIPGARAAKAATPAIPIVFYTGADPVRLGLVASLSRPGGNLTGITNLNIEMGPKRLQILQELMPAATVFGALLNPTSPNAETVARDLREAAAAGGLQVHILHAGTDRDFDAVFATLTRLRAGGLVIGADNFFNARSELLAALSVRHAIPAVYQTREFAAAGGLMSYGGSREEAYRQIGLYTGRILKGDKPADLPVQQVTKIELIINLETAKALGLTIPLPLLGRADEVIE
jgi:putative ABC transport system substrate-binding protein